MARKRAQISRETAMELYEDVIDRLAAPAKAPSQSPRSVESTGSPSVKTTIYLPPEDVLTIDELQSAEFRATGRRPRRSTIISRALRAYAAQVLGKGEK